MVLLLEYNIFVLFPPLAGTNCIVLFYLILFNFIFPKPKYFAWTQESASHFLYLFIYYIFCLSIYQSWIIWMIKFTKTDLSDTIYERRQNKVRLKLCYITNVIE